MSESVGGKTPIRFFDPTGPATLFHEIPLLIMKHAYFSKKLGDLYDLTKVVVNGLVYNISGTSKNGAVVVGTDYAQWQFVAPDGRLDFDDFVDMTFSQALLSIRDEVAEKPIVPWDRFVEWLFSDGKGFVPDKLCGRNHRS